jgi:hypothetical protein
VHTPCTHPEELEGGAFGHRRAPVAFRGSDVLCPGRRTDASAGVLWPRSVHPGFGRRCLRLHSPSTVHARRGWPFGRDIRPRILRTHTQHTLLTRLPPKISLNPMAPKHPPGPAMTLGNMRELGVKRLLASCLNDACRHQGLVDVSGYPADTEVPWFRSRVKCAKCGSRGNKIDVRPNWKEQPPGDSLTGKVFR